MRLIGRHLLLAALASALLALGALAEESASLDLLADHLDLTEVQGRVVYVDFWASWCTPCLKSFPWMDELQTSHEEDGLVILAINVDREGAAAQRFLAKQDVSFRILRDPEGSLASEFDVEAMPTSFAFDRDGRLAFRHEGFRDADTPALQEKISQLLDVEPDDTDDAK